MSAIEQKCTVDTLTNLHPNVSCLVIDGLTTSVVQPSLLQRKLFNRLFVEAYLRCLLRHA
jgi:hypothetical protein